MTTLTDSIILVTGGTGSIGSEIIKQCLALGAKKVIAFSRDETKHFEILKEFRDKRLSTIIGDVRNMQSLEIAFNTKEYEHNYPHDIDIIYHAAAMKHVPMCEDAPNEVALTNVIGTHNLVTLATKYQIPKLITISTDKAFQPTTVMGASKLMAERITLNAGYSCVRFGNVANSRGSVIPTYIKDLLNHKPLCVRHPDITRFIMRIGEAVDLVIKATSQLKGGEVYVLPMPAFRLGDLVEVMTNRIAPKLKVKAEIKYDKLLPYEKMHEFLSADVSSQYVRMLTLDELEEIVNEYIKERLVEGHFLR